MHPIDRRDPGWLPAIRRLPLAVIHPMPMRISTPDRHPISVLRVVYLSNLIRLVLIAVILATIVRRSSISQPAWVIAALLAYGLATFLFTLMFWRRPLSGDTPTAVAGSYRSSIFVMMAAAMSPALLGFVLSFTTDRLSTYLIGVGLALPGLYLAAPRSGDLPRREAQLLEKGIAVDLLEALSPQR